MFRVDRQVTDIDDIVAIISRCDVCRLALNSDDGFPYIIPLNFGWDRCNDVIHLYFHSAMAGEKHRLMARDNRASFEMDCNHTLLSVTQRGYCTMNYESVIGAGHLEYITDYDQKLSALTLLTDRYHNEHFDFNTAAVERTSVYRLKVERITAKRKASKP